MNPTKERTFFERPGVQVTISRLVFGAQTFALANITSVKLRDDGKEIIGQFFLLMAGLAALIFDGWLVKVGGVLAMILAVVLLVRAKSTYSVVLAASSGELQAYKSHDEKEITAIVTAINEAIIARH
ncbi:MAG: DUF6232 family protein [Chthoniobacter sp.]|nr:DUF6232 family protein [Chthoniobacter sp.]